MKTARIMAVAVLIVGSGLALHVARGQQSESKRTDLQRQDLSAPGREVVQVRVDFDRGYVAPKHIHPGEEIIYVLEGTLEYQIECKPPVTVKPGDVLLRRSIWVGLKERLHSLLAAPAALVLPRRSSL